jgi:hypothetical protein
MPGTISAARVRRISPGTDGPEDPGRADAGNDTPGYTGPPPRTARPPLPRRRRRPRRRDSAGRASARPPPPPRLLLAEAAGVIRAHAAPRPAARAGGANSDGNEQQAGSGHPGRPPSGQLQAPRAHQLPPVPGRASGQAPLVLPNTGNRLEGRGRVMQAGAGISGRRSMAASGTPVRAWRAACGMRRRTAGLEDAGLADTGPAGVIHRRGRVRQDDDPADACRRRGSQVHRGASAGIPAASGTPWPWAGPADPCRVRPGQDGP